MTILDSTIFGPLFGDEEINDVFSDRAYVCALVSVESALARAEARVGVIPAAAAAQIAAVNADKIDVAALTKGTLRSGFPIISLVQELRKQVSADAAPYIHWGATTQDIMDTASVLQLRAAILLFRKTILSGSILSSTRVSNDKPVGTLDRSYLLLVWLTLFPVAVFASLSLFRASKLNWTGPCWLGLIPFIALLVTQKPDLGVPKLLAWCQRAWPATIVILLLFYGAALHYLGLGSPKVPYPQNVQLMGWQAFGRDIQVIVTQLERETGEEILVVGMDRNQIASGLAFYRTKYTDSLIANTGQNPAMQTASGHLFGENSLMYELWFPVKKQNNKAMLLVSGDMKDLTGDEVLSRVQSAGEIKDIKTWKNGKQTGQYYYRLVKGYQGKPVATKPVASAPLD
mgnify:CR=1 FL=1